MRSWAWLLRSPAGLRTPGAAAGGALTCLLLLMAQRPEWPGWWALVALVPLLLLTRSRTRLPALCAAAAVASLGSSLPAFEGVLPTHAWAFPLLVILHVPQVLVPLLAWRFFLAREQELLALLAFASVWTAFEFVSSRYWLAGGLTSFYSLAYSQFDTPLLLAVRWSGTPLLAFLLVSFNAALVPALRRRSFIPLLAVAAVLTLLSVPPAGRPAAAHGGSAGDLRLTLVQPAFSRLQYRTAVRQPQAEGMLLHALLAQTAASDGSDLVIWPETVIPPAAAHGGSPDLAALLPGPPVVLGQVTERDGERFNSVLLAGPAGPERVFDKLALVPGLESSVLSSGGHYAVLETEGVPWAPLVCLDSVYPEFSRASVRAGARLLVVLSNTEFAEFLATPQLHLRVSAFRAAELGVPLAFSASSGPSALIDPWGRVIAAAGMSEQVTLGVTVPQATEPTLFLLWGNWFGWLVTSLTGAGLLFLIVPLRAVTRSSWP
jgi:apolipoprotein N-acyltransferase